MSQLSNTELKRLASKLQVLERQELRDSGLKSIQGGFCIIEHYDYDDDIIDIEIQTGVQGEYTRSENAKLDRQTLNLI